MKHARTGVRTYFISMSKSFSLPLVTEMFHFTRCPTCTYVFSTGLHGITHARFPYSEISGLTVACHLPGAYRRLLRPSSACSVEPSTVCPYTLQPLQGQIWRLKSRSFGSLLRALRRSRITYISFACSSLAEISSIFLTISSARILQMQAGTYSSVLF